MRIPVARPSHRGEVNWLLYSELLERGMSSEDLEILKEAAAARDSAPDDLAEYCWLRAGGRSSQMLRQWLSCLGVLDRIVLAHAMPYPATYITRYGWDQNFAIVLYEPDRPHAYVTHCAALPARR